MVRTRNIRECSSLTKVDDESIKHLKESICNGKSWFIALLEAINLWESTEELHKKRKYCYLINGEAFDWLLLAERLLDAVNGLVPEVEATAFLEHGKPPLKLNKAEFRRLMGDKKYRAYLNYYYGVTVEEALINAVVNEVRKERFASGLKGMDGTEDEAYKRLYGADKSYLLQLLLPGKVNTVDSSGYFKEFFYKLFRYRLTICEKDRIASDTRKGLIELNRLQREARKNQR